MQTGLLWALTVLSLQWSSLTYSLSATEPLFPASLHPWGFTSSQGQRNSFSLCFYPREFVYNLPFDGILPSKPILKKPKLCVCTYIYMNMNVYGLGFWSIRTRKCPRQLIVFLPHHNPPLKQ